MKWNESDEAAHVAQSLRIGDFKMSNGFGWSYPAGVTDSDIDNAVGANDDNTLEAHREWAEEANQRMTAIFNRVTSMLVRNVVKQEDAAFLLKEVSDAQEWLENFVPGQGKEHQQI